MVLTLPGVMVEPGVALTIRLELGYKKNLRTVRQKINPDEDSAYKYNSQK
jgi:hypothetical protein